MDGPLLVTETEEVSTGAVPGITYTRCLLREASAIAEQERLCQEAARVAIEAAEQERLQREAIAAEQVWLQREAAEQERREQEERVRIKQERLRKEVEARAAAEMAKNDFREKPKREQLPKQLNKNKEQATEQERIRREAEEQAAEQSCATTQIDVTPDLPSLITQLREASDPPDEDHSAIVEPHGIAMRNGLEDGGQAALDSHAVEATTNDGSPPRTITAGLEPIHEEAEVSNPVPSVIIDDDRQRQLREQIAERRRADKEKVANAERSPLEIDNHFTQTRSAEDEDLYEPDEEATIMANAPAWPGTEETSLGNVAPNSSATAEQAAPPASGLARLWRNRNPAPKEAMSQRNETSDPRRQLPPLLDDLGADSIIFWV
ncbi:hypothetical protein PENOC_105180 [Penicillium occitanis (nom. inval.)]|nr:hypothetical protein PENOC_105180 [Penicillium occitanis (nom. inval.)]